MQKTYSFEKCYQILHLEPKCTWNELRKKYKQAIQKWHPDRYKDGSNEKIAADDKVREINIAYHLLQKYYRENGTLPFLQVEKSVPNTPRQNAPVERPSNSVNKTTNSHSTHAYETRQEQPNRKTRKSHTSTIFILISCIAGGYYYLFSDENAPNNKSNQIINKTTKQNLPGYSSIEINHIKNKTNKLINDFQSNKSHQSSNETTASSEPLYFTEGSSIGDVISAQGTPTRTEDNVWYYGKSEVHFNEGKVTHWVRSKETGLRANLQFHQQVKK